MSTSLLYRAFGVRGCPYVRTEYPCGQIRFTVWLERSTLRCRRCGCDEVILRGKTVREFRAMPIGRRRLWTTLPIQRVECRTCHAVQQGD